MFLEPFSAPIRIVSRPKHSGFGEHWGVQLPEGAVIHRTTQGVELVGLHEFAQGRAVREVKRAKSEAYPEIMERVCEALQQPYGYRLLDDNCEHFATWLIGEKRESPQVMGWAAASAVVLALSLANR
jgi:hypothetical protein